MEKILNIPSENWISPTGFDPGIEQIIIEDTLDTENKKWIRTRFVRL